MTRTTRFIPALVLAGALGGSAISQAQIVCTIPCPVWDFSAILRNTLIASLKKQINDVLSDEQEQLVEMATRLSAYTPLGKYGIAMEDTPEWRIHDWFSGAVLFANDFHHALTYGDASGSGYDSVSLSRQAPDEALFLALSGEAQRALGADMATLDLADSTIIRGTHETGRLRFNGREEARTIQALQEAVTDGDEEQSITAVMDKISAAGLMEAQDQQARIQFLAATLEQLLVDSKRDRDQDAALMNMRLNALEDGGRMGRSLVQGAETSLRTWRQP